MDILVAGAGIGGLAVANGLIADGHHVRVLEGGDALRSGGAAVTIYSNGGAALAGLGAPLVAPGGSIETLEIRRASGRRLSRFDLRPMTRRTGFPVVTVPRRALLAQLAGSLPAGTIQFGVAAATVTVDENGGATVVDRDGRSHPADLVVGADGQGSAVRRSILDPRPATSAGWTTWQGLTAVLPDRAGGTFAQLLVGDAGLCGLMPAGGGLLQWWFDVPDPDPAPAPGEVLPWLRSQFGGYADPVPALLDGVREDELGEYPHVVHDVPDVWGRGNSTLLGDAAHAFPPSQAQGANQALEDALLLTTTLRQDAPIADRLRSYERQRTPRVRRVSRMAASEITNRPPNPFVGALSRLVPPRAAGLGYLAMIRRYSNVLNGPAR